jgi:hypothetical protein
MYSRSIVLSLFLATASAFAPLQASVRLSETSLNAGPNPAELVRKSVASFAAGVVILSNVAVVPAIAFEDFDFGSSQVIAARSGGRAGGRSSSYKAPPAVRSAAKSQPERVIIRETRIVTPSYSSGAVMMAPPMYAAPQPGIPGIGVIAGLGAINAIGDGMREARQENEIRDARQQVVEARIKEAELEARLKSLERAQVPIGAAP